MDTHPEEDESATEQVTPPPPAVASDEVARNDAIRNRLDMLRDEVDILQAAAAKEHRRWYQDASIILSVLALTVSTIFSIQSLYQQRVASKRDDAARSLAERKQKLEDLRQLIVTITDSRNEEAQEYSTLAPTNLALYQQRSAIRNSKRQVMLESADALAAELRGYVSANVLTTLAFEHFMDSNWRSAAAYYTVAVKLAPNDVSRIASKIGLAGLHMAPGSSLHDVSRGRALYEEVLAGLAKRRDEYARQQRVTLLLNQAWHESNNGNIQYVQDLVARALSEVKTMNPLNPARQQLLTSIGAIYDDAGRPRLAPSHDVIKELAGEWVLRDRNRANFTGRLSIAPANAVTPASAVVEHFDGDVLTKKYSGAVQPAAGHAIRIDWVGAKPYSMGGVATVVGVTTIRIGCRRSTYCGVEATVGEQQVTFTLSRK